MQVTPSPQQVHRRPLELRTPGAVFPDVGHVVAVRRDRLGDLVLTLPAVAALRDTYPRAALTLVVDRPLAPLARCVRGVDDVWEAPDRTAELQRRLLDSGTDLLVAISRDPQTAWAGWRCGVRHRVGTARRAYSPLFTRTIDEPRRQGPFHEVEYALSFAHRSGAAVGLARFPLVLESRAAEAAARFLRQQAIGSNYVVVHPGSGGSCPRWPRKNFAELVVALRRDGVDVVVSIGPRESELATAVHGAPSAGFAGDLLTLAALLERASLVVGSSTGPVHLAAALGTPTLAIHAPWRSCGVGRFGPYASNGWGLVADNRAARTWTRPERRRLGDELMAGVEPVVVLEAVHTLLAGRRL